MIESRQRKVALISCKTHSPRPGAGNDHLVGKNDNDALMGNVGDDLLEGGAGNDNLAGGDGFDILLGQGGNDTLSGGIGNDFLLGDFGRDVLVGGAVTDYLYGGADADKMTGGAGADTFAFNTADLGTKDTVTDSSSVWTSCSSWTSSMALGSGHQCRQQRNHAVDLQRRPSGCDDQRLDRAADHVNTGSVARARIQPRRIALTRN